MAATFSNGGDQLVVPFFTKPKTSPITEGFEVTGAERRFEFRRPGFILPAVRDEGVVH